MVPSALNVYNIELLVQLGVEELERKIPQTVWVDLQIRKAGLPQGCHTDQIQDTICYAKLCETLEDLIADRPFHLIESLTLNLYHGIEKTLPAQTKLAIKLRKKPPLNNVSLSEFCIGEWA